MLPACGSDSATGPRPGPDPDPDPVPPGALSPGERSVALTHAQLEFEALLASGLEPGAVNEALRSWLAARPEFDAAGVDESSTVWARFRDGRLLLIANNRVPEPESTSGSATSASFMAAARTATAASAAAGSGSNGELPDRGSVRLLHSFGRGFEAADLVIDAMAMMFDQAGYTLAPGSNQEAGVDVLRNVAGDAFFYLNTHGGRITFEDSTQTYALQSSTLVDSTLDVLPDYADDLDAGRLVYFTAPNGLRDAAGKRLTDTRYGITAKFVDRYMRFAPNSIVFMNACYSANMHADPAGMAAAVHRKGGRHYLGWTNVVTSDGSYRASRYFVDRMLGSNLYRPEDPLQRPFDAAFVLQDMMHDGVGRDGLADLVLNSASGDALLAPSIYGLEPLNNADEMLIHGSFGSDARPDATVTVGGTEVSVHEWTSERIHVSIPRTGPGSSGDVVVTVRGIPSNRRALVAWRGRMTYTLHGGGSLTHRIGFDLHLRGDPDQARTAAGGEAADLPEEWPIQAIADAAGSYSASGTYTFSYPGDPCTVTDTWSGSGTMQYGPVSTGASGLLYGGPVSSEKREIRLYLVAFGTHSVSEQWGGGCSGDPITVSTGFSIPPQLQTGPGFITLTLDDSYNIEASRIEATVWGPFRSEMRSTATLEWEKIPAQPHYAWLQKK